MWAFSSSERRNSDGRAQVKHSEGIMRIIDGMLIHEAHVSERATVRIDQLQGVYREAVLSFDGMRGWLLNPTRERMLHIIASCTGGALQDYLLDGNAPYPVDFPPAYQNIITSLVTQAASKQIEKIN